MKPIASVVLALCVATATRAAAGATLHDDPMSGDNLRIYTTLSAPKATLVIDGAAPSSVDGQSVMFATLGSGPHRWTVTLPDGSGASAAFVLSAEGLIESKGRRWWCLAAGRRDGQLTLLQLPPSQCKALTDAGPD